VRPDRSEKEGGFTLVEVLVALVVTALLLGIVMNAALQAKARLHAAGQKSEAVAIADALLTARAAAPFDQTVRQGHDGGLAWSTSERRIEADPRGLYLLSSIDVRVKDERGVLLFAAQVRKLKAAPQ